VLQIRPQLRQLDGLGILDEEDRVRVTDVDSYGRAQRSQGQIQKRS